MYIYVIDRETKIIDIYYGNKWWATSEDTVIVSETLIEDFTGRIEIQGHDRVFANHNYGDEVSYSRMRDLVKSDTKPKASFRRGKFIRKWIICSTRPRMKSKSIIFCIYNAEEYDVSYYTDC